MRCGHCQRNDAAITVNHVRACQMTHQAVEVAESIADGFKATMFDAMRPVQHVGSDGQPHDPFGHVAASAPVTEDGIYKHPVSGDYVKVVWNQAHTNLWGKVWEDVTETWDYTPGIIKDLRAGDRLTADQARVFGLLYGRCVFCSKELTDERSIAVGYGEKCASNQGLPWGEA